VSVEERLFKLKSLLEKGTITDEESGDRLKRILDEL
jgi:hypothetical protein